MRVQRVEWHSYQLVYEYDIPDDEITNKYNTLEVFKESIEVWEFVVGHDNSLSGLLLIHGTILGHLNREEEQTESYTKAVEQLNQENKEIPQWLIDHLS